MEGQHRSVFIKAKQKAKSEGSSDYAPPGAETNQQVRLLGAQTNRYACPAPKQTGTPSRNRDQRIGTPHPVLRPTIWYANR